MIPRLMGRVMPEVKKRVKDDMEAVVSRAAEALHLLQNKVDGGRLRKVMLLSCQNAAEIRLSHAGRR